jgi:TolA-binding protein
VHLYQARLYERETPDHLNACLSALKYLGKISPTDVTAKLWIQSRLQSVAAWRLKRDWSRAEGELDKLLQLNDSTQLELLARGERIRLALAQGQRDRAQSVVADGREIDGQVNPELDLAHLEALLCHWQTARQENRTQPAESWRKKAVELVRIIERDHSPYWLQRAENMLASAGAAGAGDDFDILQRTAKSDYLRGRFSEAVSAFGRAAKEAERAGDADAAFRLAFQAAAIQQQRDQFSDASERFRALALKYPERSEAAGAHELAILALAAELRRDPSEAQKYESLLTEHLEKWPTAASADKARLWLAKLYEHQRQLWAAARLYCGVAGKSDMQREALEGAKRCFVTDLNDEAVKDEKLAEAVNLLRQQYSSVQGQYSTRQRQAAMIAAHLRLRFARDVTADELQSTARLMQSFLGDDPGTGNLQWRDRAQSLLIAVLARRENWSRAEYELRGLQHALKDTWFDLLALLTTHHSIVTDGKQQELGRLQLAVLERISVNDQELTAEEQLQFSRWQADALLRTGSFSQAQVVLQPLVEQHPRDGQLQETYAKSLLQSDTPTVLERALAQWRIVLRRSAPQSSRWYRAKYGIALAHFKLGQSQRTAEIIKLLAALHPDLGGDETRAQFEDLLAKCKR